MSNEIRLLITPAEDERLNFIANTADTSDTLTMTANGGFMLYLQNKSLTKVLEINKIMASVSTSGGTLKWMKNLIITELDNFNNHSPVNINGEEAAEVTCYNWNGEQDGIVGIKDGIIVKTFILDEGYTPILVNSTLSAFGNIALHYIPKVGSPEFECGLQFSYKEINNG
jgi:hypothetical protein